uniref:SAM domain-containing protein n=1 Tax=Ditylenchus dipsaci TaxID=166011 RepID=A0A915EMI0_9BILA
MDSLHAHLTNTADGTNIPELMGVSANGGKYARGLSSEGRNNQVSSMDHSAEWRKIDEMLNAIQRDSFFTRSSDVTSLGESRPLTLQLKNGTDQNSAAKESQIINWLLSTGLPKTMIHKIGYVLENNGFDNVHLMKGSLTVNLMTELGFDKSVIHRLDAFISLKMKENIRSVDEFEYLSDWLDSLCLIDHLGPFAKANLTYTSDILAARLTRSDLEKMGVLPLGHIARIMRSLELAFFKSSIQRSKHLHPNSTSDTTEDNDGSQSSSDYLPTAAAGPPEFENTDERQTLLLDSCVSFSAHYLGSVEISNVEGAEDCRRAMGTNFGGGVNILDSTTNQLTVQHEINRIQVVCQDELDLNCFAYIYQDGEKNFCHVYCVLTASVAKEIIITLERLSI